jgi:spermidine synthase
MISRRTLLLGLVPLLAICGSAQTAEKTLYEKKSSYNTILVTEDDRGLRTLLFERNGVRQSVVKLGDPDYIEFPYVRGMCLGLAFVEQPKRVLIVGLGGGSIPSLLRKHYPKMTIDVVDIDPDVVAVAKRFFGFREDAAMHAHVADGRRFIEESREPYDIIFLDAYGAESIPYHLATREFLTAVRRALSPRGAVVANIWSSHLNPLHDSMVRTYQAVFDELYVFNLQGGGNEILIALPLKQRARRNELMRKAGLISQEKHFRFNMAELVRYGFHGPARRTSGGRILLDKKKTTMPSTRPAQVQGNRLGCAVDLFGPFD